jgi:hypothetical protein
MLTPADSARILAAVCFRLCQFDFFSLVVVAATQTHLVQVLAGQHITSRELPPGLPFPYNQIQRPIQTPVQLPHVVLLIALRPSRRRPLDLDPIFLRDLLSVLTDPHLRVGQDPLLHRRLARSQRTADEHLVVPAHSASGVIAADIPPRNAVALADLDPPVQLGGGVVPEVEALPERGGQALLQTLLVEEEGCLEGMEVPGEERGPGEY